MDGFDSMVHMFSSGVGVVVGVGLDVLLLIISLAVVRRHRPDVAKWFVASAVIGLVLSVVMPLANMLAARIGWDLMGDGSIHMIFSGLAMVGSLFGALAFVLLIVGIAKMAKPRGEAVAK